MSRSSLVTLSRLRTQILCAGAAVRAGSREACEQVDHGSCVVSDHLSGMTQEMSLAQEAVPVPAPALSNKH